LLSPELIDQCPACAAATLTLAICRSCGEWALAAMEHDHTLRLRPRWVPKDVTEDTLGFPARIACFFRPARPGDTNLTRIDLVSRRIDAIGPRHATLQQLRECPCCRQGVEEFVPM
jgi:hypothetical protein